MLSRFVLLPLLVLGVIGVASAADWSVPEQELGRKIVTLTGKGPASITFENRSSLGRRDSEIIENGITGVLDHLGLTLTRTNQGSAEIKISLSENVTSYLWIAEVKRGDGEPEIVMVSTPRAALPGSAHESVPLSLRQIRLWTQPDPILDLSVLEEDAAPIRMAVLSPQAVTLYRSQAGKWQAEQTMEIAHEKPWPRDLRGHLVMAKDHLLDVYLPGVFCRIEARPQPSLACRESNDPWPLTTQPISGAGSSGEGAGNLVNVPPTGAFFATTRNFFTGALTPSVGGASSVGRFYLAAAVLGGTSALWLFSGTDGRIHVVDGKTDQIARLDWGSDLAGVKTACGAGWQVLATSSDREFGDSVRAYELPNRDPIAVSGAVDFPGGISALWTEGKGDSAIAVAKNQLTGNYEAFRLAVACSQ